MDEQQQRQHRAALDRRAVEQRQSEVRRRQYLDRIERHRRQREDDQRRRELIHRRTVEVRDRSAHERARRQEASRPDVGSADRQRTYELAVQLEAARAELSRRRHEERQDLVAEVRETAQREPLPPVAWDLTPQPQLPDIEEKRAEFEQIREEMWQRYGVHIYEQDAQEAAARELGDKRSEPQRTPSVEERRAAYEAARDQQRREGPQTPEERRAAYEVARDQQRREVPAGIEDRRAAYEAARVPAAEPQPDRGYQAGEWDRDRDR